MGFQVSNVCNLCLLYATVKHKEILHSQYTLHSHAEENGLGSQKQEGLPAEFRSDIRVDYGMRKR